MNRLLALALAVLATPAVAKEARTTIAVSCNVVSSSASAQMASTTTTRACGPNCVIKTTVY